MIALFSLWSILGWAVEATVLITLAGAVVGSDWWRGLDLARDRRDSAVFRAELARISGEQRDALAEIHAARRTAVVELYQVLREHTELPGGRP